MNSMATEEGLQAMVVVRVLPPKELILWQAVEGEDFPTPNTGDIVVFASFCFHVCTYSAPTWVYPEPLAVHRAR